MLDIQIKIGLNCLLVMTGRILIEDSCAWPCSLFDTQQNFYFIALHSVQLRRQVCCDLIVDLTRLVRISYAVLAVISLYCLSNYDYTLSITGIFVSNI